MARKPDIKGDRDNWGAVLNEYLDTLTPGAGEVIVGGADGPVAVATGEIGGDGRLTVEDSFFEWWIHPAATYQTQPYPRTVFGGTTSDGMITACEFNHATGATKRYVIGEAIVDDHCQPSIFVEHERRTFAVWTKHNKDGPYLHYKIGSRDGDLSSLVPGTQGQQLVVGPASYTQVYKITHLSDDAQDTFWIFFRYGDRWWAMQPVSINQATGTPTWGTRTRLFSSGTETGQIYMASADAHNAGSQMIRMAIGHHAIDPSSAIWAFELDCVTGEITNPSDPAFSTSMTGSPDINLETQMPVLVTRAGQENRWLHAVRPGPASFAFGTVEWDDATASGRDGARYQVTEILDQAGLVLNGGTAQVADHPGLDTTTGFTFTAAIKTPAVAPTGNVEIARRWTHPDVASAMFRVRIAADKKVSAPIVRGDTKTVNDYITPSPLPFAWGDDLGIRVQAHPETGAKIDYSLNPLDSTPTWTNALTSTAWTMETNASTDPLILGGLTTEALAQMLYYAELRDGSGTLLAGVDFRDEWPAGSGTHTDSAGMAWTLTGSAVVVSSVNTLDGGPAGDPFDLPGQGRYYPGIHFPEPNYDGTAVVAGVEAGQSFVRLLRPSGATYGAETLASHAITEGRYVRPYSPKNGGPLRAVVTRIRRYNGFTDFLGDIEGHG